MDAIRTRQRLSLPHAARAALLLSFALAAGACRGPETSLSFGEEQNATSVSPPHEVLVAEPAGADAR